MPKIDNLWDINLRVIQSSIIPDASGRRDPTDKGGER